MIHRGAMATTFTRRALLHRMANGAGGLLCAPALLSLLSRHASAIAARGSAPAPRRLILLWLEGGPSQLDTFDPKEGAPTQGPFQTLATDVAGWRFSEHLPQLAKRAGRLALLRSVTSKEGSHARARLLLHTGFIPNPSVAYPTLGSIVAHELGDEAFELPSFVQVAGPPGSPGYLGVGAAPFLVANPLAKVANLSLPRGIDGARLTRREELREALDAGFHAAGGTDEVAANRTQHLRARRLMESALKGAFELDQEKDSVRDRYGRDFFGQGVLLARRLIEAGVPAVEVHGDGWDTHVDNFTKMVPLCTSLDQALSALVDDLAERGLLEDTLVVTMGEFGRTPGINHNRGRDHWPGNYCVLLAGGGSRPGTVVGATDETGERIVERPISVPDLFATFATLLRIDGAKKFDATPRRPTTLVDPDGAPVREVIA
jgi:uncharacterized protein (DUF1501 family)